jgi:hypothetical protein
MFLIPWIIAGLMCPMTASGQETGYALSTKCWEPFITNENSYGFRLRQQPPPDCIDRNGVFVLKVAIVDTYTKAATDLKLTALKKDIDDLTNKTIDAIKKSVKDNSVQGDQVDKLVTSIEEKLYDRILRRVKADLQPTPPAKAAGAKP